MLLGLYIPPTLKASQDPPPGAAGHGWREGHLGYHNNSNNNDHYYNDKLYLYGTFHKGM